MVKKAIDLMKYWPVFTAFIGAIAGYATLQNEVTNLRNSETTQWRLITESNKDIISLRERLARVER